MTSPLPAVTIAANNYLALARVWAESYLEHHPGATLYLCVADTPNPAVDYGAFPARVIFAHELPIPAFRNFAFRYDLLELSTAVKPYLLAHLRDKFGLDRVLYFDPDILVLDRLADLESTLERHPMALTPHITAPLDDRRDPSERKIRMVGVYNLGFLGVRLDDSTRGFLAWWSEKLHRFCRNEPWSGLFVDQAWMDFAPAFVDGVAILRDSIYNVAYWNLAQREVRSKGGRWWVANRPLGFFHFSGVDLSDLDRVSRHQDRVAPGGVPAVLPLYEEYRRRAEAAGHAALRQLPYGYGRFSPDGPAIPAIARQTLQRLDPWGRRFPDPFDLRAQDCYFDYLGEPLVSPRGITNRAVLALWEARPDLRRHFPDPAGRHLDDFRRWLALDEPGHGEFPLEWRCGVIDVPETGLDFHGALAGPSPPDVRPPRARDFLAELDLANAGPLTPWLNDPVPGTAHRRPMLTRLAMLIHAARPDLESAYPDPLGRDQRAYARWFCRFAATQENLHRDLVRPVEESFRWFSPRTRPALPMTQERPSGAVVAPPAPVFASRGMGGGKAAQGPPGLNLVGPLTDRGPLGEWARGLRTIARSCGWPVAELDVDDDAWGQQVAGLGQPADGVPHGLTFVASSAAEVRAALGRVPAPRIADGGMIGLWSWDYRWLAPDLAYWSVPFDEIWTPNRAVALALAPVVDLTARIVPPWLGPESAPDPAARRALRAEWGIDDVAGRFVFLATFDGRDEDDERENLFGVIRAFAALGSLENAGLCVAATAVRPSHARASALAQRIAGLPAALVLDPHRTADLFAATDGFIALPRADGWGLSAARAARAGKPVVASEADTVMAWLDEETGYPVPGRPARIGAWRRSLPPTVVWSEAELTIATAALAAVVADPAAARVRAERARVRVEELHGEGAATRIRAELERLGRRNR